MVNNIDDLTQKIYQEGIEKANQEAEKILEEAKSNAEKILKQAEKEAEALRQKANKEAESYQRNSLSEIKLGSQQALSSLKQDIQHLLSEKILNQKIEEAFEDATFIKSIIIEIIKEWEKDAGINLTISEKLRKKIGSSFEKELIKQVRGLDINFDKKLKNGFKVAQTGKTFQITFTEEDFVEFFKPFLREKIREILFN